MRRSGRAVPWCLRLFLFWEKETGLLVYLACLRAMGSSVRTCGRVDLVERKGGGGIRSTWLLRSFHYREEGILSSEEDFGGSQSTR